jgi:hypothetical protein
VKAQNIYGDSIETMGNGAIIIAIPDPPIDL